MKKSTHNKVLSFTEDEFNKLNNKAKELNTNSTKLLKDGMRLVLGMDKTLNKRTELMVENQERFNELNRALDREDIVAAKDIVKDIVKGELEAWQV